MLSGDPVTPSFTPRSRKQAQFLAALNRLGPADSSELVEGPGAMSLNSVFRHEKLGGDLAIAEAAGDQGKDFEFACCDTEALLLGRIGSEGFGSGDFRGDKHFPHHDRLMGWLLGLAHLVNLVFGAALGGSGIAPAELRACASTTFLRQAATASSVLGEDADLYLDIQRLNPFRAEVYRATREALARLEGLVETNDRGGWEEALTAARRSVLDEA